MLMKTKAQLITELETAQKRIEKLEHVLKKQTPAKDGGQEQEKLARLLEILPVGISILDGEQKGVFQNSALSRILDLNAEGIKTGSYKKRKYLAADGSPMPADGFASVQAEKSGQAVYNVETGVVKESGETIWTNVSAIPVDLPDWKTVIVTSDITERKLLETSLRESRENLQYFFDSASDLIQSVDEKGNYLYVNATWCRTLGYATEEALQMTMMDIIDPSHHEHCRALLNSLIVDQHPQQLEVVFRNKAGEPVIVEGSVSSRRDKNGHIATNGIFRNITERKRAEEALRESYDQLSIANIALENAMRVKDEFLASMSHELRTPLTGILGLSEAIQMNTYGELNDKQKKILNSIHDSGNHLLTLINDILDLSKIEAGKLEIETSPSLLSDICQASLQLTKGMAHQKHQHVKYSATVEPILLDVDARRVKQILVNLLSNAIKFTPENGELGLDVEPDGVKQQVRLIVWDKGIGIKPENLSKLFQPFTQIDSGLAREYSGTGLGLSLVQRLVELHNAV
jgi:PAS domain S-box-containing protein